MNVERHCNPSAEREQDAYALRRSLFMAVYEAAEEILLDEGLPIDFWEDDTLAGGTAFDGKDVAANAMCLLGMLKRLKNKYIRCPVPKVDE